MLRIIEPNLTGHAGHYGEFVRALASRVTPGEGRIEVDGGAGIEQLPELSMSHVTRRSMAGRSEWSVVRESARDASTPFLILTAKAKHAWMLQRARRAPGLSHARLYVHWCERGWMKRLAVVASPSVRAEALAIAPTPGIAEFLRATGWRRVEEVPYPAVAEGVVLDHPAAPRHLLMAGAARLNKGLALLVDACRSWASGSCPPAATLLVQSTGKRAGTHGAEEAQLLDQLAALKQPWLTLDPTAPDRDAYVSRFHGAIVLAPYDPRVFKDNVSGIALDALLHGAPVVATAGTWAADVVERFGSGVVMAEWSASALVDAVAQAERTWPTMSRRAVEASRILADEHDPRRLWEVLTSPVS